MLNIVFMCSAAMSTSIVMNKVAAAADEQDFPCVMSACAAQAAQEVAHTADIIVLGPQVAFMADEVRETCPQSKVIVADAGAYGMLDGTKILEQVKQAAQA